MALRYTGHGGDCCGARHIHGFRHNTGQEDARELINALANRLGHTNGTKLQEVILSNRQTREKPELVAELARLGFVYTSSWTGNHGTPVHRFERAARRLALQDSCFFNDWTNQHNGMVAGPSLGGRLPTFNEQGQPQQRQRDPFHRGFEAGDLVRILSPTSGRHNQEHVIRAIVDNYDRYGYRNGFKARFGTGDDSFYIVLRNLRLVRRHDEQEQQEQEEPAERPVYRHPDNNNGPVQQNQDPAVVLDEWYGVFRRSGNRTPAYATRQELQDAHPRVRNLLNRVIYSDGRIEEHQHRHA